jgi:hypothetical protein
MIGLLGGDGRISKVADGHDAFEAQARESCPYREDVELRLIDQAVVDCVER